MFTEVTPQSIEHFSRVASAKSGAPVSKLFGTPKNSRLSTFCQKLKGWADATLWCTMLIKESNRSSAHAEQTGGARARLK